MCTQRFIEEFYIQSGIQLVHYVSDRYNKQLYALKAIDQKTVRKIHSRPSLILLLLLLLLNLTIILASHYCSCLVKRLTRKYNKTASIISSIQKYFILWISLRKSIEELCKKAKVTLHIINKKIIVKVFIVLYYKEIVLVFSVAVNNPLYAGTLVTSWTTARQNIFAKRSPTALYALSFLSLAILIITARCYYVSYGHDTNPIVQFNKSTPTKLISLIKTDNSNSQSHSSKVLVLRVPNINVTRKSIVQSDIRIIQRNSKILSLFNNEKFNITSINIKHSNTNNIKTKIINFKSTNRRKRDINNNSRHLYLVNNQISIEDSKSYSAPKTTTASVYDDNSNGVVKNISVNVSRVSDNTNNNLRNYTIYKTIEESIQRTTTKRPMPSAHDHSHNSCKLTLFF